MALGLPQDPRPSTPSPAPSPPPSTPPAPPAAPPQPPPTSPPPPGFTPPAPPSAPPPSPSPPPTPSTPPVAGEPGGERPSRRRSIGAGVAVYVAAALVVWTSIAVLTAHYGRAHWDVTQVRQFTLAPETKDLLRRLNKPLRVTSIFPPRGDVSARVRAELDTLLDLFAGETRWLERQRIDSDRDPAAAREIIDRLKLDSSKALFGVAVEYGDRSRLVPRDRLVELEEIVVQGRRVVREKAFHGEHALASAILNLVEDATPKIDLIAGHGELDPENPGKEGFLFAKTAMVEEKMEVRTRFLLETGEIPADTDVVIIAGPIEPYDPKEVTAIAKFLERGGGLLVLQGPQRYTALEPLLGRYGVALGDDLVVDPIGARVGSSQTSIYVTGKGKHPITSLLGTSVVLVVTSRSVNARQGPNLPLRLERTELLLSSSRSWAESDLAKPPSRDPEKGDRTGPISLGMAAVVNPDPSHPTSASTGGTRLVVFGSRETFTNAYLSRAYGNEDLFQNSVNWLGKRDRLASVRPRTPDVRPLNLTQQQARRLASVAYAGPASLFVAIALMIWWRRRA